LRLFDTDIVAEPHAYVGAVPPNLPAPTPSPDLTVDVDRAPEGTVSLAVARQYVGAHFSS
jgi:hypothetical protein